MLSCPACTIPTFAASGAFLSIGGHSRGRPLGSGCSHRLRPRKIELSGKRASDYERRSQGPISTVRGHGRARRLMIIDRAAPSSCSDGGQQARRSAMSRWLSSLVGSEAATKNEAAVVVPQSRSMTPPFHHCRTTHGSTERRPPRFDAKVVHARREERNSGPGFGALHEADC